MSEAALTAIGFLRRLKWIDRAPLFPRIEPYRLRLFELALDTFDADGRPRFNLILSGRAKKNWKTADLVFAALYALVAPGPAGYECYLLANDEDQAGDDLSLAKKLVDVNPMLADWLTVRAKMIERNDGKGFLEILPAGDVVGSHGKTFRFAGFDEIHGFRSWDILEAMQLDPTRLDAQQWITSYASIYHRPGVPLFDLTLQGRKGLDPRMLFSWYAADYTTDPNFSEADPETRANPSRGSWPDQGYLEQQRRRLPAHKYRRLHLNLPGLPEGSAFQPEPVMDAFTRGERVRPPQAGVEYRAAVDMSGGSNDDAVLAIGHEDVDGRTVVDLVINQGPPPPFDPRKAVERFARVLAEYRVAHVVGDRYAGRTFVEDFSSHNVSYTPTELSASEAYEALEPRLNSHQVILVDEPTLEQQLLGLVWRGGKIDHMNGEHDDYAAAVAALVALTGAENGWISYMKNEARKAQMSA
ncbi:MAG: hypothetical protein NT151_11815 [Acidobacteria bacterium]|nr:hypothetical protein [Acidobacteriota bacterium]